MNNIMLDIETLSTKLNAIVIQASFIRFDWNGNYEEPFVLKFDMNEQLSKGLDIDADTLRWWLKTNPTLLQNLLTQGSFQLAYKSTSEKLKELQSYINNNDIIWCHATFDIPILANLFNTFNVHIPWGYKNIRDIRTLTDLAQLDLTQYNWLKEKTHDAIDDCKFQIKYCCDAYNKLKGDK